MGKSFYFLLLTLLFLKACEINQYKEYVEVKNELNNRKKKAYYEELFDKHHDYRAVYEWFESSPPQFEGAKGNVYKAINGSVLVGESKDYYEFSDDKKFKYLFDSENFYYLVDFDEEKMGLKLNNVRRIKKGFGKQPMHDLLFDDAGHLVKEVFQNKVKCRLYNKNGNYYFEFKAKVNKESIVTVMDLGKEKDFNDE